MNRIHIALAAVLALAATPFAAGIALPGDVSDVPVNYVVGFEDMPADRDQYLGETVLQADEDLRFFLVEVRDVVAFELQVRLDENVRYFHIDELAVHALLTPNDTHYAGYQYSMKPATTNMEAAWDVTLGTTSAKVCVTDSGLYSAHQDFASLTLGGWRDFVNGKASPYDDNGHGTHVTGTIAANTNNAKGVAGVAQATVYSAKVLNRQGSGTWTQVTNGMKWCADQGAHVTSMSLGASSGNSQLLDAVNYADARNVLQVAAAGNDGPCTNCVGYPAAYDVVMAVASTDQNNAQSSFSSEGPQVDIAAPGTDIPSTWPAGKNPCGRNDSNCYVLSSGTSMATPHVAGLAALIKTVNPSFTADDLELRLESTAKDLGASGWDAEFGHGLIQGTAV